MSLVEAGSLAALDFELHDPQQDRASLLRLAGWCEQFAPIVGIEGSDNLCLDITGLGPQFAGPEAIQESFARIGLTAAVSVADTLGAAWAFARYGKMAPGELPLSALRLPEGVVQTLKQLGVERIEQLDKLPRSALASRFDPQLLLRWDQFTGKIAEPILSHRPPPEIMVESQLEYPITDQESIQFILKGLVEQVCKSLSERQAGAIQLECQIQCEHAEPIKLLLGLYRPSVNARHLSELIEMQWERRTLPGPVMAVKLSVLVSARLEVRQQELFEPSSSESRRQVALLVDRLSSRLGCNQVVRAVPQADAQPEMAFRYESLATTRAKSKPKTIKRRLHRPIRLEREPIPLETISVAPDGPPVQFGGQRVAHAWGPERIQTAWWRGHYVQRDYYRVETTTGKRFWIFRRLQDGKWFLHGVFD